MEREGDLSRNQMDISHRDCIDRLIDLNHKKMVFGWAIGVKRHNFYKRIPFNKVLFDSVTNTQSVTEFETINRENKKRVQVRKD